MTKICLQHEGARLAAWLEAEEMNRGIERNAHRRTGRELERHAVVPILQLEGVAVGHLERDGREIHCLGHQNTKIVSVPPIPEAMQFQAVVACRLSMMNLSPGSRVKEPAPLIAATPGTGPVIPAVGKLGG